MLNRIFKSVILGVFSLLIITNFSSCKKEKETIGIIIVKNSSGAVVSGATVKLFPTAKPSPYTGLPPSASLTKTEVTDAQGRAQFTYELESILNIEVDKRVGNNTYTGQSVIRLLKEQTVSQTVEIY